MEAKIKELQEAYQEALINKKPSAEMYNLELIYLLGKLTDALSDKPRNSGADSGK
jgi:hypothetical protein